MKKLKIIIGLVLVLVITFCILNIKLVKTTTYFVNQLETTYESYGLMGGDHTKNVNYIGLPIDITPVGRMIIVKIDKVVEDNRYTFIEKVLKKYYSFDDRVNDVFINGGGTISIDCRN